MSLETPYSFLKCFLSNELIDRITEELNLFETQQDPNNNAHFTAHDVKQYMGICFYTTVHFPSFRANWSDHIKNVISP